MQSRQLSFGAQSRTSLERLRLAPAFAGPWKAFWASRLLVLGAAWLAVAIFGTVPAHLGFDPPGVVDGFGTPLQDALAAPFARWDSVWYLWIGQHGYAAGAAPAFFPLYPALLGAPGWAGLLAGVAVSSASLLAALVLLWRLTEIELGRAAAGAAVSLCAFAPLAFFLSAVYSESLFLALTLGAFWYARTERWPQAGTLAALAAATRPGGILVAPALLALGMRQPGRSRRLGWLALGPLGLGAFMGWLALHGIDALAPLEAQRQWGRQLTVPLSGLVDGARAAAAGVQQLLSGQVAHNYWPAAGGDPMDAAWHNVGLFALTLAGLAPLWLALRTLPLAYGLYAAGGAVIALSGPVAAQPLMSVPRFLLVLFPLPMAAGLWLARHPRARAPLLGASAVAMCFFAAQFATWHWVA